jgi:hypothetical protein
MRRLGRAAMFASLGFAAVAQATALPEPSDGGAAQEAAPPRRKIVAGFTLIAQQLSHPNPHLPPLLIAWASRTTDTLRGMYKVCLATDGTVSDVATMKSIVGADEVIAQQIRAGWRYKPQPEPVCFVAALTFKLPPPPRLPPGAEAPDPPSKR